MPTAEVLNRGENHELERRGVGATSRSRFRARKREPTDS
jgi:hypothetical protein